MKSVGIEFLPVYLYLFIPELLIDHVNINCMETKFIKMYLFLLSVDNATPELNLLDFH